MRPLKPALQSAAALSLLLAVSTLLWCLLATLGDQAGATVARVVACLLGLCWLLNLAALVAVLALKELAREREEDGEG